MTIKIKSFGPFSGGGTYARPAYFGGEAIGPAILYGDTRQISRKKLVLEDGFASLSIKGRFKIGRDDEGKYVESGQVKSIEISQNGEGKVQAWTGLNWNVRDIEKVIRRAEDGDKWAFENFLNGFDYAWTLAPKGSSGGWAQTSANDDRIKGSNRADQIFAGEGNDRVQGRGGGDDVWAADGNDALYGGGGGDLLRGEDGNDKLWGGKGVDNLQGGGGNDVVRGGAGDDFVRGEWDGSGKAGNDKLYGDDGDDQLSGGGGSDRLWGGAGNDQLGGDDTHKARAQSGNDKLWGGSGRDLLDGGNGNDSLYGGTGNDTLDGGQGNDVLDGGDGADRLWGGDGVDEIIGGRGDDVLRGEDGADIFDFTGPDTGVDSADFDLRKDFRLEGAPLTLTDKLRLDPGARAQVAMIDDPDPEAGFGAEVLALLIFEPAGAGERQTGTVILNGGLTEQDLAAAQALVDDSIL